MKAEEMPQQGKIIKKSVKEVYEEFCVNGRKDRAYRTKQKRIAFGIIIFAKNSASGIWKITPLVGMAS